MVWPNWRPMPETEQIPNREGAIIRARYRTLMRIRWRNPTLRAEDKAKKRLPLDWHDWMECPAERGHLSRWCTCESWLTAARPTNHPVQQTLKNRERRAELKIEGQYSYKEVERAREQGLQLKDRGPGAKQGALGISLYVKTIDTPTRSPSIDPRRDAGANDQARVPSDGENMRQGLVCLRAPAQARSSSEPLRARTADSAASDGREGSTIQGAGGSGSERLRGGRRLRIPPWILGVGRHLSYLFSRRRTAR